MNHFIEQLDLEEMNHFGLDEAPFDFLDDYRDIWLSPKGKQAIGQIKKAIKKNRIILLAGDVGSGKTTLLRHLVLQLQKDKSVRQIWPDTLEKSKLNGNHLIEMVLRDLGAEKMPRSVVARTKLVKKHLEQAVETGMNPILIIDEAHDLQSGMFVALKRLWDSGVLFRFMAILIVGQGGYDENDQPFGIVQELQHNPSVREFSERCQIVDLGRLNGGLGQYVQWRLSQVKSSSDRIFAADALTALSKRVRTPQQANILALRAMKEAFRDGRKQVGAEHVNAV